MSFQAPRGTHDVLPNESHRWRQIEQTFAEMASLYGYREIRTPMFEDTDLFVRTSGDTSEVVTKQMYTFEDKGGRLMTLKPEGTAPAMRSYLEHNLGQQGATTRLFYITPLFRYERPQKGRWRQHHQLGIELIGSSSPCADAEVIEMTVRFYRELGLKGVKVLLNSLGREETRSNYRQALVKFAEPYLSQLDPENKERALKNPLRLLDSKDPATQEAMQNAPKVLEYLEEESKKRFDELQGLLSEAEIDYEVQPGIVRGLDYYTDTVFEIQSTSLGAQSALCGGGRYDNLISEIGGPVTPSVGVGMGIERLILALDALENEPPSPRLDAFLVIGTPDASQTVRRLASGLRLVGVSCTFDFDGKSMKSQLKTADRLGAKFSVIIGEDELAAGHASVKNMKTSEQVLVPQNDLPDFLRR